ncbi:hypothetical protein DV735_g4351, partial [Chaetothyriales sp. CBS 134920]
MRLSNGLRALSGVPCARKAAVVRPLSSLASSWTAPPSTSEASASCTRARYKPKSSLTRQQVRHSSSPASSALKHTPLYDLHVSHNAKLVPFANFSMPLEYSDQSHVASHNWTRTHSSLFDVSHMVQHKLSGPLAQEFLMTITPSAIDTLPKHSSTLSCLLSSSGGIVDDTVITRLGRDSFYFVTNAGCRETDLAFLQSSLSQFLSSQSAPNDSIIWHILEHHSLIALQGPLSASVLQPLIFTESDDASVDTDLSTLHFSQSRWLQLQLPESCTPEHASLSTPSLLISRTGYTGEDGFEISIPPENGSSASLATSIVKTLLSNPDCKLAGLAARDSLRLEAGMCLYGHDISTETTPPVASLGWVVGKSRRSNPEPAFNGSEIINAQLANPKTLPTRRVGFLVESGPAAREGADILSVNEDGSYGEPIGKVTSGLPSPTLDGQNIAMGYVKTGWHKKGTKVGIKVRTKVREGEVAKMPFVENKFYRG